MCGRGYEPDTLVAWPTAEISVMGPEGAVDIIFTKQIAAAADPAAARAEYAAAVRQTIDPFIAAFMGDGRRHHRPRGHATGDHRRTGGC